MLKSCVKSFGHFLCLTGMYCVVFNVLGLYCVVFNVLGLYCVVFTVLGFTVWDVISENVNYAHGIL